MLDILTAIYYDEFTGLRGKAMLKPPYTIAEARLHRRLQGIDPQTAKALEQEIRAFAIEQRDEAFHCGAKFGAQLAVQLLEDC